jgi:type II secretory pathway pseudopilin PulG
MSKHTRSSLAFSLVEVVATAAGIGLLLAFAIGAVQSGLRNNRENNIRQNLQTVWVAANEYFLSQQKTEVTLADLAKPNTGSSAVASLEKVADEDYASVNGGKITRKDSKLEVTYGTASGGSPRTVTYKTGQ